MAKILFVLLVFVFLFPSQIRAGEVVVSTSARLKTDFVQERLDERVVVLKTYLEKRGSPLSAYAPDFVASADRYDIDWRLVPAITGVESSFGKRIPYNSYNAYGWANGKYRFSSWEESIEIVSKTLREKYIDKGAKNLNQIGRRYAPPSKTWASKVEFFMKEIGNAPAPFDL